MVVGPRQRGQVSLKILQKKKKGFERKTNNASLNNDKS